MSKTKDISVRISDEQYSIVMALSLAEGKTIKKIIEQALKNYFKSKKIQ
jgi:hypothetical protein